MTIESLGFRRLVLGLQPGAPDRTAELAVEFASLFDLELLGLFIDDLGVRHLAAMPAARAISAFGAGWRRLEPNHAPGASDYAAESAGRRFADVARRLTRRRFEVVRGGAAQAVAAISRAEDILVIVPPSAAADRAAEPFASLLEAAFGSAAAVMLAPPRITRAAGAVVTIAASPDDPSLDAGRAIAEAAGEPLVVIDIRALAGDALRVERKRQAGEAISRIDQGPLDYAAEAAHHALKGLAERLTVVSRGAIRNELALKIALARGAPVLSLGRRQRGEG